MSHSAKHSRPHPRLVGMTLVEMLIALAILGFVIVMASSGIVQSLTVNRLQEDATNTQAKLRRVTELVTQELRSAVLGSISDYPTESNHRAVSFALLSGDGGVVVEPAPGNSWGASAVTYVYASDREIVDALVGGPAVLINGNGEAVFIPNINQVGGSFNGNGNGNGPNVVHPGCYIPVEYTPNTRLYGARALGYRYDPDEQILYEVRFGGSGMVEEPLAFSLTDFAIDYEYVSASGRVSTAEPYRDSNGAPQPVYLDSGTTYELARLQLTLVGESGRVERSYDSFVEVSGMGNSFRPVTSMVMCENGSGNGNGNGNGNNGNGNGNNGNGKP